MNRQDKGKGYVKTREDEHHDSVGETHLRKEVEIKNEEYNRINSYYHHLVISEIKERFNAATVAIDFNN